MKKFEQKEMFSILKDIKFKLQERRASVSNFYNHFCAFYTTKKYNMIIKVSHAWNCASAYMPFKKIFGKQKKSPKVSINVLSLGASFSLLQKKELIC